MISLNPYWLLSVVFLVLGCSQNSHIQTKPNVTFVMTDDLGYGGVSSYGPQISPAPTIDKLAHSSLRFTGDHSSGVTSSRSRFSIITGTVTDPSGQGVPDATVFFVNRSNLEDYFETRTDSKGSYSVDVSQQLTNDTSNSRLKSFDVHITGWGIFPYQEREVVFASKYKRDFVVQTTDLWDENRIVLRSTFNNSRLQFNKGTGRVVFMGGSITDMKGWRNSVETYLQKAFPEAELEFIEAGIPSLGSLYHSFRYQRDIEPKGKVDLLFLESAVNDDREYNRTNNTVRSRAHEGIIRQARLANPEVDIVQMHFLNEKYYDSGYGKDVLIPEYQAYDRVGHAYNSSMINMSHFVAERYSWAEFGGNVHPNRNASLIYADNIIAMFTKAWKTPLPQTYQAFSYPLPHLVDEFSYVNGRFISIKSAYNLTGWDITKSGIPKLKKNRQDFINRPLLSGKPGDTLHFNFAGKLVGVEGVMYKNLGRLRYSIDDGKYSGVVDTQSTVALYIGRAFVFEDELDDGEHVLTLTVEPAGKDSKGEVMILNFLAN